MEHNLLAAGTQNLHFEVADSHHVALSLITNPSTSLSTLSSLLKSLIINLHNTTLQPHTTQHHRRIISLLSALSTRHPDLRREISATLRAFAFLPSTSVPSLAHSLSVLFSIPNPDDDAGDDASDEPVFLSLCFRSLRASLRYWLLRNASRFRVRPSVLITVMLGFTKDPYPLTRKAALDELVLLGNVVVVEDQSLVQGCYFRATELLFDADDSVRRSAVRAVSQWGLLLVKSSQDKCKIVWSDTLFVQLCSTVRDMSMKVRLEAFNALWKVGIVSEDILLQTLAKKASSATKGKNFSGQYTAELVKLPAASAAFAFVHGLEDEFAEVRRSACFALRNLATLSADFACEAVSLLMDMLNDDSVDVRLQSLDTMHHLAMCNLLKLQKGHLRMLLGTLVDSSALIRSAARKILQLTKLHQFSMFKFCFESLMRNLEMYPQDEAGLLFVLFCIGHDHGNFVVNLIQERLEEIEPSFGDRFAFESLRSIALLVLAISAPVSFEQSSCSIPPRLYSYAAALLGRICHGLDGLVNQNDLLSRLFQCSQFSFVSDFDSFKGVEPVFPLSKRDLLFCENTNGISGSYSQKLLELEKVRHQTPDYSVEINDEMGNCMNNVIQKVHNVWPLVCCGFTDEATRILRGWKRELKSLTRDSVEPMGELAFILQYLDIVEMLGRVWMHHMFPLKSCFSGVGMLEVLLGQLERSLNEMRYKFMGLTSEQEVHILEMILVTYTLKMCSLKACCLHAYPKKLSCVVAQVEHLMEGKTADVSSYVIEVQKTVGEVGHSILENPNLMQKCLEHYCLKQLKLAGTPLLHAKADLDLFNNYENPLRFVSGLPVGIPCEITLYNISSKSRVWLKMTLHEKLSEFVHIDLNDLSGSGCVEKRKFTFVAPFYRTPKVSFFRLKVYIALECWSIIARDELIQLSDEKEVYLSTQVG